MIHFSLVIPVYNEEPVIQQIYSRCTTALEKITDRYEIICIDDGSKDNTLQYLLQFHHRDKRFKVISLSRNFGHQSAIFAGLTYTKGEYVGIIDGDLQDPPELLQVFIDKLKEGFDVAKKKGRRFR